MAFMHSHPHSPRGAMIGEDPACPQALRASGLTWLLQGSEPPLERGAPQGPQCWGSERSGHRLTLAPQ